MTQHPRSPHTPAQRAQRKRRGLLARFARDERGVTAIQVALVTPVLALMIFGGLEITRMIFTQNSIEEAVNETVRFASVHGAASSSPATTTQLETMASDVEGLDPADFTPTVTYTPNNVPGSVVTIDVDYAYTPLTGYAFGASITLNASASRTITR